MKRKILLLAAVLLAVCALNARVLVRLYEITGETGYYQGQASLLRERNSKLYEKISRMEKDPFYTEKVARDELGLVREGEWVIRER